MPIVRWCDTYSVNVAEIDEQHKKLLDLVNDLHSAIESLADKNELKDMLDELVEFTRTHFSTEEELMKQHGFPELKKHRKEHKLLLRYLVELVDGVSGGKKLYFYSDYDVSTDWALIHIIECDKSLGAFLNSKGVF